MNINEKLQEIKTKIDKEHYFFVRPYAYLDDGEESFDDEIEWMYNTIKQLQEENESLNNLVDKLEIGIKRQSVKHGEAKKRIEELETSAKKQVEQIESYYENRLSKITAAHEAFLEEVRYSVNLEIIYNKHFYELIHLEEQVRLAKISAGVKK